MGEAERDASKLLEISMGLFLDSTSDKKDEISQSISWRREMSTYYANMTEGDLSHWTAIQV